MEKYKKISLLGAGLGGEVWECLAADGHIVAVKYFSQGKDAAEDEYNYGQEFSHPNIVHPISLFMQDSVPIMTMPYMEVRSVDNVAGFISEKTAWRLIRDIASALDYLHGKGVCHGDIKPSNILSDGESFLLGDLGSCFKLGEQPEIADRSSYQYVAPESSKTFKSDIWSLGASVFYMILGTPVFRGLGGKAQKKDSDVPLMRKSMPELSECVKACLAFSAGERPSAEELVRLAIQQLIRCEAATPVRPARPAERPSNADISSGFWPDKMIDTV